ncbi:MAG TPA: 50S ribosomal protein L37ae [Candidatus Nanoarchaeia archaeon]|nr:50S ribosomal protein L37ae [Candidatus Nanoarchaeia archaeon]
MANVEKLTSTRRYGARYGPRNKIQADKIERVLRSYQKCPYCTYKNVKRVTNGVWLCGKCRIQFTSRAYTVDRSKIQDQ